MMANNREHRRRRSSGFFTVDDASTFAIECSEGQGDSIPTVER
jgi:hypothetical protein